MQMLNQLRFLVTLAIALTAIATSGQLPDAPPLNRPPAEGPGPDGPRRFGPPPGGVQDDTKLVKQFDKDGDKRLNAVERRAAREFLQNEKAEGRGPRRPGPRGPIGESTTEPLAAGAKISPADVKSFPSASLYDATALRTFFIELENADWEKELADFYRTDVEVPAKV